MEFEPKSERQIIEESLIPADTECDFEVIDAEDKVSKKNNEMIELTIRVFRPDGRAAQIRDWLMPNMVKLVRFCAATGLSDKYEAGRLEAADCVGRAGKLVVGIQKDKTGQYPDQNNVKTYKALADGEMPLAPAGSKLDPADIPF